MMSRLDLGQSVVSPPRPRATAPSLDAWCLAGLAGRRLSAIIVGVTGAFACESGEDAQVGGPVVLALGAKEAPSYSDGELTLYESQVPRAVPGSASRPQLRYGEPQGVASAVPADAVSARRRRDGRRS